MTGSGARKEVKYCRYPTGEISRLIYPNGTVVDRNYTGRGQLKDVGWGAGATSYVYWPDGKVDYQARTNGVTTRYGYDGRGMISSVLHEKSNQSLAFREYWRDNRDRIVAWKRGMANVPNGMETGRGDRYAYDAEGQLTQASYRAFLGPEPLLTPSDAKRSDSFQYDALGNRYGSNRIASRGIYLDFTRRDNGLNQYQMWSPYSAIYHDDNWFAPWVWPGNGVMMADGYITASYNALNQPVAIGSQGLGSNYNWFWHDPLGRCVKRWLGNGDGIPTGPITYLYYDGWNLAQEGPNASTADRLYVHGGRVDEIVASKLGGQWYNHQYDARGHCLLLTNSSGAIQEQYDYDAFGMPYIYNAAGTSLGNSGGVGNRFLFTGREWIKDLRVYDYRNRVYQPELGRFLQPDPKQFEAGDYNLYRYCHNDPVNKSDPLGLKPPEEGLIDLQKDTLMKMFEAGKQNNTDTNTRQNYDKQGRKVEFRRDGFKKDGKTENGVSRGTWASRRPQAGPPENPNGGTRVYTTHSHVTGSNQHLDHDKAVANGYGVPSGVTYSGGGAMQIYVPREGGGQGKTYYTHDGATLTTDRAGNKPMDW